MEDLDLLRALSEVHLQIQDLAEVGVVHLSLGHSDF